MVKSKISKGFPIFFFIIVFICIAQLRVYGREQSESSNSMVQTPTIDVSNFNELQIAVNNAPLDGTPTIINIINSFTMTSDINLSGGRNIIIQSNDEHILTRTSFRHFNIGTNSSLTLEDNVILDGNNQGGGVYVGDTPITGNNASFTMNGGMITRCASGGVSVSGGTLFTMKGGIIKENNAFNIGGGIGLHGTFIMEGGTIEANSANNNGGGVNIQPGGSFTMYDGVIRDNESGSGGGIMVWGTFNMEGGTIDKNSAFNMGGGGIHVTSSGNFAMNGGTISDNTTNGDGGGIYFTSSGDFTISGGTISDNTASGDGGGIMSSGAIAMEGGTIERNSANNGGGIYIRQLNSNSLLVGSKVIFGGNNATFDYRPPLNVEHVLPDIETRTSTLYDHPLNNVDIGYTTINPAIRTLRLLKDPTMGGEVNIEGETNLSSRRIFQGSNVQLKAVPASGYLFKEWTSSNGGTFADTPNPNTTFTMPNNDTTVTANFAEIVNLTFLDFFPDENLAQVIANRFSRQVTDEVTEEELNSLTGIISGSYKNISDLEGMQYLTVISHVFMDGNKLTNESLEPLSQLPNLMMLFLNGNQITDLSIFSNSSNPLFTISATDQRIILDPINKDEVTEGVFIRTRYGQVPDTMAGGVYNIDRGTITWPGVGEHTLSWYDSSSHSNFSGIITQVVNP